MYQTTEMTLLRLLNLRRGWMLVAGLALLVGCQTTPKQDKSAKAEAEKPEAKQVAKGPRAEQEAPPKQTEQKPTAKAEQAEPDFENMDAEELAKYIRKLAEATGAQPGKGDPNDPRVGRKRRMTQDELDDVHQRRTRKDDVVPYGKYEEEEAQSSPPPASEQPIALKPKQKEDGADKPKAPARSKQADEEAKEGKKGCGDAGNLDTTPPDPNAPQPKYVCKNPTVKVENVWKGARPEFTFKIANAGDAPLTVNLKGG